MDIRASIGIVIVDGTLINGQSYSGLKSQAAKLSANGVTATNNGLASVAGERVGFNIFAGAAILSGCKAFNTGGGSSQLYGINWGVDAIQLAACDFVGNATAAAFYTTPAGSGSQSVGCLPVSLNAACSLSGTNATFGGTFSAGFVASVINNAAGVTISGAQLVGGVIVRTGAVAVSDTTPSAAQIVAAIPNCVTGSAVFLDLVSANTGILTILAGSGVTLLGKTAIGANHTRRYLIIVTNATASSEAVSMRGLIEAPN